MLSHAPRHLHPLTMVGSGVAAGGVQGGVRRDEEGEGGREGERDRGEEQWWERNGWEGR